MRSLFLLVLSLFLLSDFTLVLANCGLAGCPVVYEPKPVHIFDQVFRYVAFDIDHHAGSYLQFEPRYEYRGWKKGIVGGYASLISLDTGHESESGLTNPVIFGQWDLFHEPTQQLAVGSQLELALGDDEDGLAAEHTEVVPYATYSRFYSSINWMGSVGYRHSLESGDHGHGGPGHAILLVNPHEDKEFLYRFHAQFLNLYETMTPEFFLDGQHALDGDDDGKGFLSIGGGVRFSMGSSFAITPKVEFPITRPQRFDSRFSFHGALRF